MKLLAKDLKKRAKTVDVGVHIHRYTMGRDTYSKQSHGKAIDKDYVEDEASIGGNSIGDWS